MLYIEDIIDSIEKINKYTQEMEFVDFDSNDMVVDAVIRNLEIIGEASNKDPKEIKLKHPEVPWNEMC